MIPADAENKDLTVEDIAAIYKVAVTQVHNWTSMEGFPPGRPAGVLGTLLVRNAEAVDAWLEKNFRVYWAQGQDSDNPLGLPEGGDKDLLSLADIGRLEAQVIGREEPVPATTLRGYISKGTMPGPDRTPGDRKEGEPEVTDRKWYRATVYQWLQRPRRARRSSKSSTPSAAPAPAGGAGEEPTVSTANEPKSLGVRQIASKYLVSEATVRNWAKLDGFPAMHPKTKTYNAAAVDRWVREHKKRAWAAAQEQMAQAAPGAAAITPAEGSNASAARPAGAKGRSRRKQRVELDLEGIAKRFDQPLSTVGYWARTEEKREGGKVVRPAFPESLRRERPRTWDQDDVDAWVMAARPHVWASFTGTGPLLPEGNPRDLLDVDDFAMIWAEATNGEPNSRSTMHAYHSRGQIPFADRAPDDGGSPTVFAYHWYRETVYEFIRSRRGKGNFEPR
ncbi:helix-turn-helix domain-containing protein [Streptomyces sp. NPDC001407]|uniref:helix-turn-helix domain-containing protein n=1 Tax=Streptomyces sp. NPDC001407 TaxID=3364573 RepID=UPI0036B8CF32